MLNFLETLAHSCDIKYIYVLQSTKLNKLTVMSKYVKKGM